jgi:hypothetical protein
MGEQILLFEATLAAIPQHAPAAHHDDLGETILVQVVDENRMDAGAPLGEAPFVAQDALEGRRARSDEHPQTRGVDLRGNGRAGRVAAVGPLHRQITRDDEAALQRLVHHVEYDRDERARWGAVFGGNEASVMPLGLDEPMPRCGQLTDQCSPIAGRDGPVGGPESEDLDAVRKPLGGAARPEPQRLEVDGGEHIRLGGGVSAPPRLVQGVPE